eukprot:SAG31_NODE_7046_length_1804_cov_2.980059_2_plen_154_part_00
MYPTALNDRYVNCYSSLQPQEHRSASIQSVVTMKHLQRGRLAPLQLREATGVITASGFDFVSGTSFDFGLGFGTVSGFDSSSSSASDCGHRPVFALCKKQVNSNKSKIDRAASKIAKTGHPTGKGKGKGKNSKPLNKNQAHQGGALTRKKKVK